jgi:hypothetical protein
MIRRLQQLARRMQRSRTLRWAYLFQLVAANLLVFVIFAVPAHADDCSIDPRRAEDCLRTPNFAENLSTAVAVIGTVLVNGVAIQTIILQRKDPNDSDDDTPPVTYSLDVRTQDSRTEIKPDGKDMLWLYASVSCSDPKVDCSGMTASITFAPSGANADWLQIPQTTDSGGNKAALLMAANPNPAAMVPNPSASVEISAPVPGGTLTANVPITIPAQQAEWDVLLKPDGVTEIMPDTKESLTLYARIKFDETAFTDPAELQRVKDETKASIKMLSSTDWVKLDDPLQDTGDYMASWIIASNPSGNVGAIQGPESCTVTISGSFNGTPLPAHSETIKLTTRPEIDAQPDLVQLLAGSHASTDVSVWISNPGTGAWSFEPRVTEGSAELVTLSKDDKSPSTTVVTIAENAGNLNTSDSKVYCTVSVFAKNDQLQLELERQIKVAICQEGLIVTYCASGDTIHVRADGKQQKTEVDLCVYIYNSDSKELQANAETAKAIEIDIDEEVKSTGYNVDSACVVHHDSDGMTADNCSAKFQWWAEKEIPGEDRMIVHYKASVPGKDPEKFSKQLPVTIEAMSLEEESAAKEVELQRCRDIISKYIPAGKQAQFNALVDRRMDTLGPKGLATLRHKIWDIAVNLILAEGAEGYKDEAAWADRIVTVLEWAEWAGDIAFNAATAALCGPIGQIAAPLIKSALVSAVNCYQNGEDFEAWATENLWGVWGVIEGQALDIERLTKLTGGSKYKAWAIYVGYTFGKKLYQGRSLVDAAKETAQEIGMLEFNNWLGEKAKASYQKHGLGGSKPTSDETTPASPGKDDSSSAKGPSDDAGAKPDDSATKKQDDAPAKPDDSTTKKQDEVTATTDDSAAKKQDDASAKPDDPGTTKTGDDTSAPPDDPGNRKPGDDVPTAFDDPNNPPPDPADRPSRDDAWRQGREDGQQAIEQLQDALNGDNPETKRQAALRFLRDKNAMMELNFTDGANDTRQQLKDQLNEIYKETDAGTKTDLAAEYGVPENNIRTFNPSNPKKPSDKVTVSYDRDVTYQRLCKEGEIIRDPLSGKFRKANAEDWVDIPADVTEKHYARNFYEAATGQQGASDSQVQDYAHAHDQTCTDRLSPDAYGNRQRDLDTALKYPGRDFSDPQQIGQCMEYKANEWFEKADHVEATNPSEAEGYRAEGMRQTFKQYDNQVLKRVEALEKQGVEVKTDTRLDNAMQELKKVERGEQSPEQAEQKLQDMGYQSPQDVAHDSGNYLEMLQKLRPKLPKG